MRRGTGWGVPKIAAAWEQLMLRLGYDRFGAQGGDWGSMVTQRIGVFHTDHLAGIHVNMPLVIPSTPPEEMTPMEQSAVAGLAHYMTKDNGYSTQQSTRPQTVGYGLADSPVGQMSWIVEKFWAWTDCDGDPRYVLTADELLDNVMVYWLTNTAACSARLYWESFSDIDFSPIEVPSGISIFPHEIFRCSRRWAETRFTDLRHFNELERGGHFAAFEQPELFVAEVRVRVPYDALTRRRPRGSSSAVAPDRCSEATASAGPNSWLSWPKPRVGPLDRIIPRLVG